ncbi:MAG TPA: formyltransferase family protein [Pilimelia sp.]|nr:formyltransferase family protein [Pilimelia sp.]
MTRKGLAVLEAIVAKFGPPAVRRVIGARDTAVAEDYYDAIRERAAAYGIPAVDRRDAAPPAVDEPCLAVGWRWLITGTQRLVVIHDSLLPRYRGFAPLVSCLVNGEPRIGATALLASEEYDEGDIIAQDSVDITYPITAGAAIELLAAVYVRLAVTVADRVVSGDELTGRPQDHAAATYSLWRDEEDYRVDWSWPASRIRRLVDAVGHPYRGASTLVEGRLARLRAVAERADVAVENRTPGKVIFMADGCPVVVCGEGLLTITDLVDDETAASLLPLRRFRTRFR